MSGTQSWIVTVLSLLGLQIAGDVADLTIYTNRRGKIVWYPATKPETPPSASQISQRNRFRSAVNLWNSLTPADKAQWTFAANRASLCATGMNLFISAALTPAPDSLAKLASRTRTTLVQPSYCGWG